MAKIFQKGSKMPFLARFFFNLAYGAENLVKTSFGRVEKINLVDDRNKVDKVLEIRAPSKKS